MTGRLPALTPGELDEAQRRLYDTLVANEIPWADSSTVRVIEPDGSLLGPFNPLLFSPDLGAAQIGMFRADKRSTSLTARVHEIVILTVGAAWGSEYELYAHSAVGRRAGLSDDLIDALVMGNPPDFESEADTSAHEFTRQLVHRHRVDERAYTRAVRAFGHKGVVDLVLLIGLYMTTCASSTRSTYRFPERSPDRNHPGAPVPPFPRHRSLENQAWRAWQASALRAVEAALRFD